MAGALKMVLLSLACAALVLQPAAAYTFNFGGGALSGRLRRTRVFAEHATVALPVAPSCK